MRKRQTHYRLIPEQNSGLLKTWLFSGEGKPKFSGTANPDCGRLDTCRRKAETKIRIQMDYVRWTRTGGYLSKAGPAMTSSPPCPPCCLNLLPLSDIISVGCGFAGRGRGVGDEAGLDSPLVWRCWSWGGDFGRSGWGTGRAGRKGGGGVTRSCPQPWTAPSGSCSGARCCRSSPGRRERSCGRDPSSRSAEGPL